MSVNVKSKGRKQLLAFKQSGDNPNDAPVWTSEPYEVSNATSLNDDGDVVGTTRNGEAVYLYHSSLDKIFQLDELVDDAYFLEMRPQHDANRVIERINSMLTPSPIVVGASSGSGTGEQRLFFLIPEDTP